MLLQYFKRGNKTSRGLSVIFWACYQLPSSRSFVKYMGQCARGGAKRVAKKYCIIFLMHFYKPKSH